MKNLNWWEWKIQKYYPKTCVELYQMLFFDKIKADLIDFKEYQDDFIRLDDYYHLMMRDKDDHRYDIYENTQKIIYWSVSDWDVSKIEDFSCCFECVDFEDWNQDLSKWNVSNWKIFNDMFFDSNFDWNCNFNLWEKCISVCQMFWWLFTWKNAQNLSNWNTKNVKDFSFMFSCCYLDKNFKIQLDYSSWTDFKFMLSQAKYYFDISKIKDKEKLFWYEK